MTDDRTTERVDHPPRVREAIDELMREKDVTDNRTTELLREGLTERGIEWRSGLEGVTFVGDWCFVEYDNGRLAATCEPVLTPEQAVAATLGSWTCAFAKPTDLTDGCAALERIAELEAELGSERELIDLAHNAWSMALCAMQGMPIPADWGNSVEQGLRKYGINVDEELSAFEVIDE